MNNTCLHISPLRGTGECEMFAEHRYYRFVNGKLCFVNIVDFVNGEKNIYIHLRHDHINHRYRSHTFVSYQGTA